MLFIQNQSHIYGIYRSADVVRSQKTSSGRKADSFSTTHYMEEAANAGYVVILDKGSIVAEGTPFELKNEYAGHYVCLWCDRRRNQNTGQRV